MPLSMISELWRLNKQQWASADELESIAIGKLHRQLWRAYDLSPFYRKRFASLGFRPSDLRTLEDITYLPLTTRSEFVGAGGDMFCSDVDLKKCSWAKSSGSSGAPVHVPLTRLDKRRRVLKELRALGSLGFRFSDRMLVVWVPRTTINRYPLLQRVGLLRRDYTSVFASESEQLSVINSLRPDVLYSYTSNLRILAEAIMSGSEPAPKPKLLVTSAEVLEPSARELITQAFGTEPVDFYGSMEVGWIACQCAERRGYHVQSDCLVVEVLKNGRPAKAGEEGEVVVTSLHSDAAPLIRYATGDTAILSPEKCSCGRTLPLLASISGRSADYFVLPDQRRLSPYAVTSALRDVPGMYRFQVVQESERRILIRMLTGPREVDFSSIRQAVWKGLGVHVDVEIECVDSLPIEPSGKFKIVKSMIMQKSNEVTAA